ncbi:MAG: class I SAM-dependent methyltransferase [Planctomycetes bacterium]|nr:class I SAM-dependent methyltransferase [Planctomycetota bacterium]
MTDQPWFVGAFGPEYLQVYAHRSDAQAAAQVSAMRSHGLLPMRGRVLDIACGTGRHLRAMRNAGLDARGLDYSAHLLCAGALAGLAVRADMRAMPFGDATFDWACSLFTSFGYFESDQDDLRMLANARLVLRPGGALVIDHINPGPTVAALKAHTDEACEGGRLVQRRRFDSASSRIIKDLEFVTPKGTRRWQERVRVYAPNELQALLESAGLKVAARWGDLDGSPWLPASSLRQVVLARRS